MDREERREPDNLTIAVVLGAVALALVMFGVLIGRVSAMF